MKTFLRKNLKKAHVSKLPLRSHVYEYEVNNDPIIFWGTYADVHKRLLELQNRRLRPRCPTNEFVMSLTPPDLKVVASHMQMVELLLDESTEKEVILSLSCKGPAKSIGDALAPQTKLFGTREIRYLLFWLNSLGKSTFHEFNHLLKFFCALRSVGF